MLAASCPISWHGEKIAHFAHEAKPPMLKQVEDVRHVVRKLATTVMWLSGTDVPQVLEVAEIGAPLPVKSPACACGAHQRRNHRSDGGLLRLI